jgi:hypothetical protein
MTRKDLEDIIVDALHRADAMHWRGREHNRSAADMILRALKAAGVKMRGPAHYTRAADFLKPLLEARTKARRDESDERH